MSDPRAVVFDLKSRDDVCIELSLHERCYLISILRVRAADYSMTPEIERKLCGHLIEKLKPVGH